MVGFFSLAGKSSVVQGLWVFCLFSCLLSAVGISEHFSYSLPPGDQ